MPSSAAEQAEMDGAATKIQARFRGRQSRKGAPPPGVRAPNSRGINRPVAYEKKSYGGGPKPKRRGGPPNIPGAGGRGLGGGMGAKVAKGRARDQHRVPQARREGDQGAQVHGQDEGG